MSSEFFPDIPVIKYEGPDSKNPLAFKHYDAQAMIGDKTMEDHLRFSMAYWHTMRNGLSDPFGVPTAIRPWEGPVDDVANA
ncbi:MAG: xylose isomerase, partial [Verrucomicrobiales bacterium]